MMDASDQCMYWLRWHDGVHLIFVPEVVPLVLLPSDEDTVLLDVGWIVILALVCATFDGV
jgi:hypothetical protein